MPNGTDRIHHAVVTGGAGFLGSHLCDALVRSGHHVTCVDNFETGSKSNVGQLAGDPRFQLVRCDVNDGVDVDGPVEVVYHLASPAAPSDYLLDPVATMRAASVGALNALDLARDRSARFVLASTSEVYGPPGPEPSRENDPGRVDPVGDFGAYCESRRFTESLATAYRVTYNVRTAIARIFSTYGPRMRLDDGRVLSRFIRQALAGAPLTVPGSGAQTRSMCYVDDAVAAIIALAAGSYPGPVNIGNADEVSVFAIAQQVIGIAGADTELVFLEAPTSQPHARLPDITLAGQLLGWQPSTTMNDGLASTIAWFKKVGARTA